MNQIVGIPVEGAPVCERGTSLHIAVGYFRDSNEPFELATDRHYPLDLAFPHDDPEDLVDYVNRRFNEETQTSVFIGASAISLLRLCFNRVHEDGEISRTGMRAELHDTIVVASPEDKREHCPSGLWLPHGNPTDCEMGGQSNLPLRLWSRRGAPPIKELVKTRTGYAPMWVALRGEETIVAPR